MAMDSGVVAPLGVRDKKDKLLRRVRSFIDSFPTKEKLSLI